MAPDGDTKVWSPAPAPDWKSSCAKKSTLIIPDLSPIKVKWLKALAVSITRKKIGWWHWPWWPSPALSALPWAWAHSSSSRSSGSMMATAEEDEATEPSWSAWAVGPSSQQARPDNNSKIKIKTKIQNFVEPQPGGGPSDSWFKFKLIISQSSVVSESVIVS